jgi:hypothetical protein
MTKADWQRIAERLYGDKGWTMQRIAKALGLRLEWRDHNVKEQDQEPDHCSSA